MKRLSLLLAVLAFATNARASLVGDQMTATWKYPPFGVIVPVNFVGGAGPVQWLPEIVVEATQDTIIVDNVTGPGTGLGDGVIWEFSGIDWNGTPGGIVNVSVNTNYVGWNDSFLSFTTDSITVNFLTPVTAGPYTDDLFELHVTGAPAPVPAPATLPLVLSGIAALVAMVRRSRKE